MGCLLQLMIIILNYTPLYRNGGCNEDNYTNTNSDNIDKAFTMISATTMQHWPTGIILARLIYGKYYVIEFDINVEATKLVPYFNLNDDKFMKFGQIVRNYSIFRENH